MYKNASHQVIVGAASVVLSAALFVGCSQLNERPVRLSVPAATEECAGGISAQLSVDGTSIRLESPTVQAAPSDGWYGVTSQTVARHTPMTVSAQCYAESGEVIGSKTSRGATDFSQSWQRDMPIIVYPESSSPIPCEDYNAMVEESGVKLCIEGFNG